MLGPVDAYQLFCVPGRPGLDPASYFRAGEHGNDAGHVLGLGYIDGENSGVGMLAVAELVADKDTNEAFDPALNVGPYLLARAQEHGLIIRALGDRIGFSPPLVITGDEINEMFGRFALALRETQEWVEAGFK